MTRCPGLTRDIDLIEVEEDKDAHFQSLVGSCDVRPALRTWLESCPEVRLVVSINLHALGLPPLPGDANRGCLEFRNPLRSLPPGDYHPSKNCFKNLTVSVGMRLSLL